MSGEASIIELVNVAYDVTWISWGVQYFFLIGLSVGAFILTMPAFVFGQRHREQAAGIALLIAISCAIAAPIALISDLHQPGRFYNFYLHFTPSSWMSWGSFFLPAYVILLLVYAWLIYRPGLAMQASNKTGVVAGLSRVLAFGGGESAAAVRMLGSLTLVAALLVALYTGTEMGVVRARPLWHSPMMPLLLFVSGVSGAAGLTLLLNGLIAGRSAVITRQMSQVLIASLSLILVLLGIWIVIGMTGLSASGDVLMRLATEYNPGAFTLLWVVICTVIPLLLAWLKPEVTWWGAGGLAVAGAWLFRWSMFIDGQRIPKTGAGFYDYLIPLGSEGWLGMLGTFGLWVLLVLLVTSFLPWQGQKEDTAAQSR